MARLPSGDEIGIANAQSGRPIANIDGTGYARGAAALAQGSQNLGEGIAKAGRDVGIGLRQRQTNTDELEVAKAESNWLLKSRFHRDELAAETEPDKLKEKYEPKFRTAYDESAGLISNPQKRALWQAKRAPDVEDNIYKTTDYAFSLTKDREIASAEEKLVGLREGALLETDEEKRKDHINTARLRIQGLVDAGYISAQKGKELQRSWVENLSTAAVQMLPPEERVKLLRPQTTNDQVVDRIIGVESGGKANAKNPLSSAYGSGQFIRDTWLSLIKEQKPELARGRTDEQLLELRGDPALSREMVGAYAAKNSAYLKSQGLEATPGNVYLAHFLGPDGAARVLKADPNTPVSEIVGRDAVRANPSILGGKTAGSVAAWADGKMGGAGPSGQVAFIPANTRMKLYRQAETEVAQRQNAAGIARGEELEAAIIDAKAGKGEMPPRSVIENDPTISESARNALKVRYDAAVGDVASAQAAWAKFQNPQGGSFNPYDKDDRDNADVIFQRLGGTPEALQAVVDRTGIMPSSAAKSLRGDLVSNDPQRVAGALALSSNLITRNQNIFSKTDGAKELEDNTVAFRHYTDTLGMTNEEAARRIIRDQSPEYQTQIKARIKAEDIDAKIRKDLNIGDLAGAFDQVPWIPFTDPKVGFTAGDRALMFSQYAEQVKDNYLNSANGDWSLAKKMAARQVGKTWGVTNVNGSPTVIQYPPERSPQFAGIDNASEAIARDAIATVKAQTGLDVARKDVWTMPISGRTGPAYKAGEPTPYQLWYRDKDGVAHMIQPGQGREFVPDAAAIKAAQTEERRAQFETQQQIAEARSNPLAEAQSVPPHRRTVAQRKVIADAEAGKLPQVAQAEPTDVASVEPFERVNPDERGGTARLPSLAELTQVPPHRRRKPEPKTKVADADR